MDPGLGKCSRLTALNGVAHLGKAQEQNPLCNHLTLLGLFSCLGAFASKSETLLASSAGGRCLKKYENYNLGIKPYS